MDRLSLLVEAKKVSEYLIEHKFIYSQNVKGTWSKAKEAKKSNCSAFVCYCLQNLGLLKPGQLLYGNSKGSITYRGTGTKKKILKKYRLINVGKTPAEYEEKLKPGDICFFNLHTNIFAGINAKGQMIWWDAGKKATNTKKDGGTYNDIHRSINISQKINFILRWKG